MKPISRTLQTVAGVTAALLVLGACDGVDFRHSIDHRCAVSYDQVWASTDLYIDHSQTTQCPVDVYAVGADVWASARGVDPGEPDVASGTQATFAVYSSNGQQVGYTSDNWSTYINTTEVFVSTAYDGSMGYPITGDPDDLAVLGTIVHGQYASATLYLDVLFGPRDTRVISPQNSMSFPAFTSCPYTAQSRLNWATRTDITKHDWFVDGQYKATGDQVSLMVFDEGSHTVEVVSTDVWGYVVSSGPIPIQVGDAYSCPT